MLINRLINKLFKHKEQEVQQQKELENINDVLNQTSTRLAKLERDLGKAISGYRLMLIKENPEILPDLLTGESIEALDRSLLTAKDLTEKVRLQIEKKAAAERIPGGAPVRTPLDPDSMSSNEKIRYGLEKK